jgi:hypothetical protein
MPAGRCTLFHHRHMTTVGPVAERFKTPAKVRGREMSGDPAECREHAKECLRIAANATRPGARELFEELARSWLRLACDLENSAALHKEWGEPSVKKSILGTIHSKIGGRHGLRVRSAR